MAVLRAYCAAILLLLSSYLAAIVNVEFLRGALTWPVETDASTMRQNSVEPPPINDLPLAQRNPKHGGRVLRLKSEELEDTEEALPPRLELLHIQKNAGSMLEVLALQSNISWGVCHFNFPWKHKTPFRNCPPVRDGKVRNRQVHWHYPLQHLKKLKFGVFPYDNHPNQSYVARPKKYFVVVRNPYDRLISMYHHATKRINTNGLNTWSQKILRDASHLGLGWTNSTICQYQYLYDAETGAAIPDVDHIVQFEHLAEDFHSLAQQYGLDLTIPKEKVNANNYNRPGAVTETDLDAATLELLNTVCARDFQLGRGYTMIWGEQQPSHE